MAIRTKERLWDHGYYLARSPRFPRHARRSSFRGSRTPQTTTVADSKTRSATVLSMAVYLSIDSESITLAIFHRSKHHRYMHKPPSFLPHPLLRRSSGGCLSTSESLIATTRHSVPRHSRIQLAPSRTLVSFFTPRPYSLFLLVGYSVLDQSFKNPSLPRGLASPWHRYTRPFQSIHAASSCQPPSIDS